MTDSVQGSLSMTGRAVNPNSPQRTRGKAPADFTGKQMQKLQREKADELAKRAEEIGLAQQAQFDAEPEEIDYTGHAPLESEVEIQPVQVMEEEVWIRVNYPIQDMTWGRDVYYPGDDQHPLGKDATEPYVGPLRMFSFEEGKRYKVKKSLADYLDSKDYLWH